MPHKPKLPGLRRSAQAVCADLRRQQQAPDQKPGDALSDFQGVRSSGRSRSCGQYFRCATLSTNRVPYSPWAGTAIPDTSREACRPTRFQPDVTSLRSDHVENLQHANYEVLVMLGVSISCQLLDDLTAVRPHDVHPKVEQGHTIQPAPTALGAVVLRLNLSLPVNCGTQQGFLGQAPALPRISSRSD